MIDKSIDEATQTVRLAEPADVRQIHVLGTSCQQIRIKVHPWSTDKMIGMLHASSTQGIIESHVKAERQPADLTGGTAVAP